MQTLSFAKGHGTMNDFVIIEDRANFTPLDEDTVRFLCDRHAGVGADGVLRVTRSQYIEDWDGDQELWFMDYRNADGSIAEICGNGLRVFARFLYEQGLVAVEPIWVGTRAGLRKVDPMPNGMIRVTMGRVIVGDDAHPEVTVDHGGRTHRATPVNVGNPHAVVLLGTETTREAFDALDLSEQPCWAPAEAFPDGVNVEFVLPLGERHLAMRVHERGSGETLSCGSGTVAAAAAFASASGSGEGDYTVDVPGGRVVVHLQNGEATLAGPAVIVATGTVRLDQ